LLEVQDLVFRYPDGREALRGVSFKIERGEKVALVGPNGAGKSTLILQLNGVLKPTSGRVQGPAGVGLVFQDPDDQLFCPTVREDVAFGPRCQKLKQDEVDRRVTDALQAVGMLDYLDRSSPHLSHGEKKRIAVATVLAMQPEVLVLDEPTAGLDPRARRELIGLLAGLEQTMLVSSHDLQLVAELFPRSILLEQGQLVADRPTGELLADSDLLTRHGLEPLCACYQTSLQEREA
jgi:energy-coupling factor transporter ATP-binding protein EcfA2